MEGRVRLTCAGGNLILSSTALDAALGESHTPPSCSGGVEAFPALAELLAHLERAAAKEPAAAFVLDPRAAGVERVRLWGDAPPVPAPSPAWNAQAPLERGPLPDLTPLELVHPQVGPLLSLYSDYSRATFAYAAAQLAAYSSRQAVWGGGRTANYRKARLVAALEALERQAGLHVQDDRRRVQATWAELGDEALDPRRLGLYAPEQYRRPGFPCRPFDPERPYTWVEGFSFTAQRPLWVEESAAFYRAATLVVGTSSGCAVGRSLEEATAYATLELFERDAAMRWWYGVEPVPRLGLSSLGGLSRTALALLDRLDALGYRLHLFAAGRLGDIPALVAVAESCRAGGGGHTLCASAARFTWAGACEQALFELLSLVELARSLTPDERRRAAHLAHHPEDVTDITDHLLAHWPPSARPRFEPLLHVGNGEQPPPGGHPPSTFGELVVLLERHGLELIAVDQTTPVLRRLGLRCVRALVPGLIPIHYGAGLERYHLLPRRRTAWPHPFA